MKKHSDKLVRLVLAALFFALAYVLPFLTGQIPEIGAMLCPMHIPILLCGFLCGAPWGAAVGFSVPLFRALTLGMPPLFPSAVCMALELAVYGATSGFLHRLLPKKSWAVYCTLLISMILGRLVWGLAQYVCIVGIKGGSFGPAAFLAGALTNSIPGIVTQIVLIPIAVILLQKQYRHHGKT